jgi:hypothetical protein
MMLPRLVLAFVLALALAGCGSSAAPSSSPSAEPTPSPTAIPTATALPTPSASVAASGSAEPFADQPYTIDLPAGWEVYDLSRLSPTALDAFGKANPGLAGAIQAFASTPNVRLAVNQLLGNAIVAIAIPSQGLPLETIGQSISAQFQAVPGVTTKPVAEAETLPAGKALHWPLSISVNKVGGGKLQVDESIHVIANATTAVLIEFVVPNGGANPDETKIIRTLRFR